MPIAVYNVSGPHNVRTRPADSDVEKNDAIRPSFLVIYR
jgi:hypothetical protein